MAKIKTTAEGGLNLSRTDELRELRETQKLLRGQLVQAQAQVKALKGQLEEIDDKIGVTIDNIDQPDLPFIEEDS